jgi:hypothetical protein
MEEPRNPAVLLVHATEELTTTTILTYPPGRPEAPLDRLLDEPGVHSVDLHRYRARLNLAPRADRRAVRHRVENVLAPDWGPSVQLPQEPGPREIGVGYAGPRLVAESLEMAGGHPILLTLFGVPGVAEAVLSRGYSGSASAASSPGRTSRDPSNRNRSCCSPTGTTS